MPSCEQAQFLYRFSRALHEQNMNVRQMLQTIVTLTGEGLGVEHGCLVTFQDHMTIENAYIIGAQTTDGIGEELWNALLRRGLVGYVYHSDRIVTIRDIRTDPRWPNLPDSPFIPRAGSAIGVPIRKGSYVYGVMLFLSPVVDAFDDATLDLLDEIVHLCSMAIGNALDARAARNGDTRYQALFDDAVVPMILTDQSGYVLDANRKACDFLGYTRAKLLHTPLTDIHDLTPQDISHDHMAQIEAGQEVYFRTTANTLGQGDVPVLVRARRVHIEGREVIEWVEQDMTAHMELEQLRRDLTAMIYHDMRGPIQTMLGSIYKLGEVLRNHENPAVLTLLSLGIRGTRQLERMVDNLLDIQRLEEGKTILDTRPVELRVLMTDAIQLVQSMAMQNRQQLAFDLPDDLPTLLIDGDMVMRVVINLLQNAIKYTPDGGTITLSAEIIDDGVRVSVTDSGPGIPANMKDQIFDKFSRVKYKNAPKGIGLGLAFCRLAVEAHGGDIWVESEDSHGSTFVFTLPRIQVDSEAAHDNQALATA